MFGRFFIILAVISSASCAKSAHACLGEGEIGDVSKVECMTIDAVASLSKNVQVIRGESTIITMHSFSPEYYSLGDVPVYLLIVGSGDLMENKFSLAIPSVSRPDLLFDGVNQDVEIFSLRMQQEKGLERVKEIRVLSDGRVSFDGVVWGAFGEFGD